MKKLCILLCLLLTLGMLVSCSGDGDDTETDPPETSTGAPQEEGLVLSVSDEVQIGVGETKLVTVINAKTGMQTTTVHWSSDNKEVADVDFEGNITGIADGTAVITATSIDGKQSASCTVNVISVLSGIELNANELNLSKGSVATLTASLIPSTYTGVELQWVSSDQSVATVDDGVITAHRNGSTTIAVSAEGFTAVCSVNVVTPVTSVELSESTLSLVKGGTKELTATVRPSDAAGYRFTWSSSNPTAVSVSDEGKLTALSGGTAIITAKTDNGISASCTVTVSVPVTGVALTPTEVKLDPGTTQKLNVSIAPIDANSQGVLWDSSDPAVATVDEYGMVKALKTGTAVIKVTTVEGYFTATCTVTVASSITGLAFEVATDELLPTESITLVPIKTPAEAPDPLYTWTSSDPLVAMVDEKGVVTALSPGTVTITASLENGVSATHTLTVVDPVSLVTPITSITLRNKEISVGKQFKLDITVLPANANEKYTIVSRNTNCVTVNSDGTLTAIRKGTVKIEVKSESGAVSASCYVTVNGLSDADRAQMQKEYDAAKSSLDQAHNNALAAIDTLYDADIERWTNELNKPGATAAQRKEAQEKLSGLQNAKKADVDAENFDYEQKLESLKDQYALLFE